MPIPFKCPHCHAFTEVDEKYAGQSGSCATCGKTIEIPRPQELAGKLTPETQRSPATAMMAFFALIGMICVAILLLGGLLAAYFVPSISLTTVSDAETQCSNNLQRIGLALQNYHAEHGEYPPAYLVDQLGRPMHSWRVLLLPYLGEQALYDQYDMSEPWDGPNNVRLSKRMPLVFASPDDPDAEFGESSYLVIVGPNMAFTGDKPRKAAELKDGSGNIVLAIEVAGSGVNWLEPKDLDSSKISWGVNTDDRGIGSQHTRGGVHVLMADGTVRHFGDFLPSDQLHAMATVDGGEPVQPQAWAD